MIEFKETDFWGSWKPPGKRKRKKDSENDCKTNIKSKTDGSQKKKKKKHLKLQDTMTRKKAKKKDKKKKKKRLRAELYDTFVFTQACGGQANPPGDGRKPDHLNQDCKIKIKKRVPPVKWPKFVSSTPQCLKESVPFKNEAVGVHESCSQATVTGHSQRLTKDDSQGTSEDVNSQDLFITQKTFRAPSPEPSSSEASDKAIPATPRVAATTQQGVPHTSAARMKKSIRSRKTGKRAKKRKMVLLTDDEEDGVSKTKQKKSLQTQSGPVVVTLSSDVPKKHSSTSSQLSLTSTGTQTENFFTTELCSFFCQRHRVSAPFEGMNAMDLSLPQRVRRDLGACLSVPGPMKGDDHKHPNLHPSCPSDEKDMEVKTVAAGQKSETTPSPRPDSEPSSADTTGSSEDNEAPTHTGKPDMAQVRRQEAVPTAVTHKYCIYFIYSHLFPHFVFEFNHTFLSNAVY